MRNSKRNAILSYVTWIGWIFVYLTRNRKDQLVRRHLNQALVLNIAGIAAGVIAIIPLVGTIAGGILEIVVWVLDIMGIIRAASWSMEPLPFISDFHLI